MVVNMYVAVLIIVSMQTHVPEETFCPQIMQIKIFLNGAPWATSKVTSCLGEVA